MSRLTRSAHGLDAGSETGWSGRTACNTGNADLFVVGPGGLSPGNREAQRLCRTCGIRDQCEADRVETPPELRRSLIIAAIAHNKEGQPCRQQAGAPRHPPRARPTCGTPAGCRSHQSAQEEYCPACVAVAKVRTRVRRPP